MDEDLDDRDILDVIETDDRYLDTYLKEKVTPPVMWWNEKSCIIPWKFFWFKYV